MSAARQIETQDGIPILRGVIFAPGRVKVMCPECGVEHCHGWPEGTPIDSLEHRSSHCLGEHKLKGRFAKTGYYIALERGEGKRCA